MKTNKFLRSIMAGLALGIALFLPACSKSDEAVQPALITLTPTAITRNSVTLGGDVISPGNQAILNWGVVIDINANPSFEKDGMYTSAGSPVGVYSRDVSPLPPNTTFHVRACLRTVSGVVYGNELTFTTLP